MGETASILRPHPHSTGTTHFSSPDQGELRLIHTQSEGDTWIQGPSAWGKHCYPKSQSSLPEPTVNAASSPFYR